MKALRTGNLLKFLNICSPADLRFTRSFVPGPRVGLPRAAEQTLARGHYSERMSATDETQTAAQPFDPAQWAQVPGFVGLTDITYHRHVGEGRENGIVRVAFDRPEVRNAFRPHTVDELYRVLDHARRSPRRRHDPC